MPSPSKIRNDEAPTLFDDLPEDPHRKDPEPDENEAPSSSPSPSHDQRRAPSSDGHGRNRVGPPATTAASRSRTVQQTPPTRMPATGASSEPDVLTVSRLAGDLRQAIESRFSNLWVEGELSNFKRHTSGHCYFTLKDDESQLRAVMWRSNATRVFFKPQNGMLVQVLADASVYEARGDLQLVVRKMRLSGEGALQKAFEDLKRKLAAEGLFDRERKRPLPAYPRAIGIVTSGSGAALHDILSILERRFPFVRVIICPVQVQGLGAAESVADAVAAFNRLEDGDERKPDVLIVGRGGGSLEDLWAFNEEVVARAVFASRIPIISAVGHETDFSITDFVADARAATPSMAAELAVPDRNELRASLRSTQDTMRNLLTHRIERQRRHVKHLIASHGFRRPVDRLNQHSQHVDELCGRLHRMVARCVEVKARRRNALADRLRILAPERPLQRGYALVERNGVTIHRAGELRAGDDVRLRFRDGARNAQVRNDQPDGTSVGGPPATTERGDSTDGAGTAPKGGRDRDDTTDSRKENVT